MKLIRQARLFFQEGRSDKIYEVDLCEVDVGRFVVNFRYGRRGAVLRDGTKTATAVEVEKAEKVFDKLVAAKRAKGYREEGDITPAAERVPVDDGAAVESARGMLLERLAREPTEGDPPLERTIWRLGERRIAEAVPRLLEVASESTGVESMEVNRRYCIAWALGRMGASTAVPLLEELREDAFPKVRRIAIHALALCLDPAGEAQLIEGGLQRLPQEIRTGVLADDSESVLAALRVYLENAEPERWSVVELLYLLSSMSGARGAVLSWLRQTPLVPPAFQRVRHIFKAAELRLDAEVLALLAYRFETTPARVNNDAYWGSYTAVGGEWIPVKQELAKPNAKIAYPSRTRAYLRRRYVRLLRRLGELNRQEFVELATETLLAFSDDDAGTPSSRESWDWQAETTRRVYYDAFGPYHVFNFLLYRHSPRYHQGSGGLYWRCSASYRPGHEAPVVREEAFPQVWDTNLDALVRLLLESRCRQVHEFAARVLTHQPDFVDGLELGVLAHWLGQPYRSTLGLALAFARRRWSSSAPSRDLVVALLDADLEEARQQAGAWIESSLTFFLSSIDFLVVVVLHPREDVRHLGRDLLADHTLPPTVDRQTFLARLLAGLLRLKPSDVDSDLTASKANLWAKDVAQTLRLVFAGLLRRLGTGVVRDLLGHVLPAVQIFGGQVLLDHETPAEELPDELLGLLLDADSEEVRGVGVQLLARLPMDRLTAQEDLVLAYCLASAPPVRAGARSLLVRVMAEDPSFASALVATLSVRLLRSERHDGLHLDVLAMVTEDLAPAALSISTDLTWRLLRSRRSAAQSLGAFRFAQISAVEFSARKLALLAGHSMASVRGLAWDRLELTLDRNPESLDDALVALDNDWVDSRDRGFTFFREQIPSEAWTPRRLVALCDSVREDVQRFGRDQLQRHCDGEHGPEILLTLCQHPSVSMQLFATHYLERFASRRPDRVQELLPYLRTVLAQVHRGRVAKDRVLAFLRDEAMADRAVAILVLPLLQEVSLTFARGDRSSVLLALRDLGLAYPDLPSLLRPITVEDRSSITEAEAS